MYEKFYISFVKFILYFTGIRAFYLAGSPNTNEIDSVTFNLNNGSVIVFKLYCEVHRNMTFRWGCMLERQNKVYTVKAIFDDSMDESLTQYNTVRVFMISSVLFLFDYKIVFKVLVDCFLDLIHKETAALKK